MKYLEEKRIGFPIVRRGRADRARRRCCSIWRSATRRFVPGLIADTPRRGRPQPDAVAEGNVGAGAGATVGKLLGSIARDEGRASGARRFTLPAAWSSPRSWPSTRSAMSTDPATGRFIAGARTEDGRSIADLRACSGRGRRAASRPHGAHDARRRRDERAADQGAGDEAGADGARRIRARDLSVAPDVGRRHDFRARHRHAPGGADLNLLGALAADAMADAIVRGVRAARGIPGYPAARDLK